MPNIHQEITIAAAPALVYQWLTDPKHFAEVTGAPATGDSKDGGAFALFGGMITGRNIELVPDTRIVQAWRPKPWPEGVYSLVRFELSADGKGTKVVLDHDGFPADMTEHLAAGWHANYWEKLTKHAG